MRTRIYLCVLLFNVLVYNPFSRGFAQSKIADRLVFDLEPRLGFVMPHHDHIAYFLKDNIAGFQFNVGLAANGQKDWHKRYNYPIAGLGFYHSTLGNNKVFGKLNGYYAFVDYKMFDIGSRFNVGHRISFGIAHNTKCFDQETNPRNFVVGSHINAFFQYDLALHYSVTQRTSVKLSGGLTHSSNGNLREPNSGFNIFTMSVGLQHYLKSYKSFHVDRPSIFTDSAKVAVLVGAFGGAKTYSIENSRMYMSYGVMAEYQYRLFASGLVGVEVSAYRDEAMREDWCSEEGNTDDFKEHHYYRFTLNPTYLIQMGRIYISLQPGIYLNFKYLPNGICSHKLGLRYQVCNNVLASIAVKTHYFANSDFIELALRYKFNMEI